MSGLRIRITALSNSEGEKILKNTTERRQSIFNILYKRRKETIDNLAFEFNVNERTIRRDLEILSVSFPIYTTQGNGGGVFILDDYKLGMKYLTDKQLELLTRLSDELPNEKDRQIIKSIITTYKNPLNK